jgi:hypothetical protein
MKKTETKTRFTYFYRRERFESREIFIYKKRYTEPELKLIDDLFNSLDESNLAIIKAFVNRKT